ncbi:MAG: radical SAM family heme chaperone HemW [Gammaproteobacteria bacterium]|nr:oxygen-independent coproporphyrinogen III oxidase-like protein [Sideroxydans sp.]MBU3902843.1 radical SAM family heme chaperone HemW [Gammaproteobacteria bacterium]MBU4045331.1 radical SAM family heme chaperone HemW [Gammaproteobacteria bacterium]
MNSQTLQPFGIKSQPVNFRALPPLSLYIHIPWCVRKCPYCDFNSHEASGTIPDREYVEALLRDLDSALPLIWGRKVYSIFIGGGTPSLLSGDALTHLLTQVRMRLPLAHEAEITLEANPGTVEADKFSAFREAGVNRLSLGIQSFNDSHLQALGRIHTGDEAKRAIDIAQTHFDNINLDLMYALPGQSQEEALLDVRSALSFAPQHLSCYHLTLEPNTLFAHNPPQLPDDDASSEMQLGIETLLAEHGYQHYETSAFAKPGKHSRHNLNYWQFGDYLGIGAGAHSKLSFHDKVIRQARHKQPKTYMDDVVHGKQVQSEQVLGKDDLAFEFMMNALRLNGGFEEHLFQERTSLPLLLIRHELGQAEQKGLLTREARRIAPTELGRRFLNDLLQVFLAAEN